MASQTQAVFATDAHHAFMVRAIVGEAGTWLRETTDGLEIAILPMTIHQLPAPALGMECRLFLVMITRPDAGRPADEVGRSISGTGVACRHAQKDWRIIANPLDRTITDRQALNAVRAVAPIALAQAADAAVRWDDRPPE